MIKEALKDTNFLGPHSEIPTLSKVKLFHDYLTPAREPVGHSLFGIVISDFKGALLLGSVRVIEREVIVSKQISRYVSQQALLPCSGH